MEDTLADPLIDAIATARVPNDRPCPTRHLSIAPPYDWSRTYMAAKDMEEYLPGVPLAATLVEATEDGFDVLASDGVTSLVHVVVERRGHQPLRPGDPVVATVAGVGLEGDLLHEGRPGEWVVRARTGGDQQPVNQIGLTVPDHQKEVLLSSQRLALAHQAVMTDMQQAAAKAAAEITVPASANTCGFAGPAADVTSVSHVMARSTRRSCHHVAY